MTIQTPGINSKGESDIVNGFAKRIRQMLSTNDSQPNNRLETEKKRKIYMERTTNSVEKTVSQENTLEVKEEEKLETLVGKQRFNSDRREAAKNLEAEISSLKVQLKLAKEKTKDKEKKNNDLRTKLDMTERMLDDAVKKTQDIEVQTKQFLVKFLEKHDPKDMFKESVTKLKEDNGNVIIADVKEEGEKQNFVSNLVQRGGIIELNNSEVEFTNSTSVKEETTETSKKGAFEVVKREVLQEKFEGEEVNNVEVTKKTDKPEVVEKYSVDTVETFASNVPDYQVRESGNNSSTNGEIYEEDQNDTVPPETDQNDTVPPETDQNDTVPPESDTEISTTITAPIGAGGSADTETDSESESSPENTGIIATNEENKFSEETDATDTTEETGEVENIVQPGTESRESDPPAIDEELRDGNVIISTLFEENKDSEEVDATVDATEETGEVKNIQIVQPGTESCESDPAATDKELRDGNVIFSTLFEENKDSEEVDATDATEETGEVKNIQSVQPGTESLESNPDARNGKRGIEQLHSSKEEEVKEDLDFEDAEHLENSVSEHDYGASMEDIEDGDSQREASHAAIEECSFCKYYYQTGQEHSCKKLKIEEPSRV